MGKMMTSWLRAMQFSESRCLLLLVQLSIGVMGYSDSTVLPSGIPRSDFLQYYPRFILNAPRRQNYYVRSRDDTDMSSQQFATQKRSVGSILEGSLIPAISDDDLFLAVRERKSNNLRNMMRIGKRSFVSTPANLDYTGASQPSRYERSLIRMSMYPKGISLFRT